MSHAKFFIRFPESDLRLSHTPSASKVAELASGGSPRAKRIGLVVLGISCLRVDTAV